MAAALGKITSETKTSGSLSCLVADDEEDICNLLIEYLDELNVFKFLIPASDGQAAKTKILNQQFNLLVVDINMPKFNGIELMRDAIEARKVKPERVLIISGDSNPENIKKLAGIGIKNFLVKPFEKEVFINKVTDMLNSTL